MEEIYRLVQKFISKDANLPSRIRVNKFRKTVKQMICSELREEQLSSLPAGGGRAVTCRMSGGGVETGQV